MLGTAIPGSCGSSTRCAGRLLHRQSPIRRTSPLPSSNRSCRGICSCALRMLTIFTSKQDRGTSSTCTATYSRAVDSCSRPPFHDTSPYDPQAELPRCECGGEIRPHICWFGEVPFELDRIFCALDECTIFMAIGTSGWSSPQPVSSPMSVAGRGPFMSGRKSPRMPPRLRNVIWAKRARCCLTCSARCDPGKVLSC